MTLLSAQTSEGQRGSWWRQRRLLTAGVLVAVVAAVVLVLAFGGSGYSPPPIANEQEALDLVLSLTVDGQTFEDYVREQYDRICPQLRRFVRFIAVSQSPFGNQFYEIGVTRDPLQVADLTKRFLAASQRCKLENTFILGIVTAAGEIRAESFQEEKRLDWLRTYLEALKSLVKCGANTSWGGAAKCLAFWAFSPRAEDKEETHTLPPSGKAFGYKSNY